jgi:hypothetical protein
MKSEFALCANIQQRKAFPHPELQALGLRAFPDHTEITRKEKRAEHIGIASPRDQHLFSLEAILRGWPSPISQFIRAYSERILF